MTFSGIVLEVTENAELMKLYSSRILALASDIPHHERLDAPQHSVKRRSPLCGSTVTVDMDVTDGRISRFGQEVRACALGQAAAAVLGQVVIGRNRADIEAARDALRRMLKDGGPAPDAPFDGYAVLEPAREYKNRHASIMLAIDATLEALQAAETSTS